MSQTSEPGRENSVAGALVVTAILAVAVLLRIYDLDRTSLWYDEAVSWSQSNGTFGALVASVSEDNYPPLHNILLWLTMPLLGDSEVALRLPSVILGVLAVWLVYRSGKTLSGQHAGLLAAALLAISPFHIWYSTEARMYALMATCGLAFLLSVLKVLMAAERRWMVALCVTGALFLYSHVYALLGYAATGCVCACFVLYQSIASRRLQFTNALAACIAMAGSAIAFLPWLLVLVNRAHSVAEEGFWIAYPDIPFLKTMVFDLAGSLLLFWILLALALGCLLTALFTAIGRGRQATLRMQMVLASAAYTFGPPLLAYLYSVLVQPILFDRYLIAAWPGLILLASDAACRIRLRSFAIPLFVAALLLTGPQLRFTLFEKIRPEWREIADDYLSLKAPDDNLVLYRGFAAPALAYYLREKNAFSPVEEITGLKKLRSGETPGWLLVVHSGTQETEDALGAVGAIAESPAAQRFGWGASGLKLVKIVPEE